MDRKEKRHKMDQAIKEITIPYLRGLGFTGSLPHFRRQSPDGINLLSFQHSQYDTMFTVEIANCPPDGITMNSGVRIPKNKVTTLNMGYRLRLGSDEPHSDFWFSYGEQLVSNDEYRKIAKEIIEHLSEAETWWTTDPFNQKTLE